jgi:hypothetical protein
MSVGIKFLYNFSVGEYDYTAPGANVLSVTSQAAGDHDKKNLTTTPLRETWRSDEDISVWQEIVLEANDLTSVCDTFALLNHNLTELAVVQVQPSMTTDFTGAPTFTMTWSEKHMVLLQDVGVAYNYWRFRILDPTNPCGFIELGRIVAGRSFAFQDDEDISDEIQLAQEDLAYKTRTEGFFRAFNERVKVDKLSIRFGKLKTAAGENTNYLGLVRMLKNVGETYPFLTIVDPADQQFILHWGVIEQLPSRSFGINRYVDLSLQIQEVY